MKRILSFVLAGLFVFIVSKSVFSVETSTESAGKEAKSAMMAASDSDMAKSESTKHHERAKSAFPMPLMMKDMMGKAMVATDDGGIVVMAGNKLMKYDQDLNLVKEVEIKMDTACMDKMMQMKEKHSMMNKPAGEGVEQAVTVQESAVKQESPAAE